ncbi:type II toxin-antitoxin system VapC family toxin [Phragmitibacter flavus]|uniref:Ribonuclease VapC n=2 Tax=Phragmitibacter flavus TaxID=2576071 RepID=A0A5R8K9Z6_9BACT|nr:type II toxin-antitoxin system VapC family toxin [Phragmitibacter flavus]
MPAMLIHLDTNLLIDLVTTGSPHIALIRQWLSENKQLGTSSIAWSEFCNGPHSKAQKDAVFAILERRIEDFTWQQAEEASRLFHRSGRRRGSHADCMIAATAISLNLPLATRNITDFRRFTPFGLNLLPIPS